jgi:CheY-like chemotaxis protein
VNPQLHGLRILVVDDEPDACRAAARLLAGLGFEVFQAHNAEQAWELVLKHEFDVLISDLEMPGMDGHELMQRVRARDGQHILLYAVALTGSSSDEQRRKAQASGFDAFLVKPATLQDLMRSILHAKSRSQSQAGRD